MSIFRLKNPKGYRYRYTVTLDGVSYVMSFRYNSRIQSYMLTIFVAASGEILRENERIGANQQILSNMSGNNAPSGDFFCFKMPVTESEVSVDDFGNNRAMILYDNTGYILKGISSTGMFGENEPLIVRHIA